MTIHWTCVVCHRALTAPDHFGGRKANCPSCKTEFRVPAAKVEEVEIIDAEVVEPPPGEDKSWDLKILQKLHEPQKVVEFLEPPADQPSSSQRPAGSASNTSNTSNTSNASAPSATPTANGGGATATMENANVGDWLKRMFESLLDPRSIQWLLTLGGGLMVLGLLIWLISKGIFSQPLPLAITFGIASISLLVTGWGLALKTRYRIAGRALTFLGCVVLPLNLWFYHAQDLVLLEQGLWIGGVVCVLLYVATVWVMRDELFMYAVQVGITLTGVLFLGSFGLAGHATQLSILLMGLALTSLHAHFAFPAQSELFDRKRFGLPLFWCGHIQLAASLIILLFTQFAGWIQPVGNFFDLPAGGNLLTNSQWAAGLLWLAGAYAYLYSDIVVRKIGVYMYLAAISLVMAEVTLLDFSVFGVEGLIAILAITACGVSLSTKLATESNARLARTIAPLALMLSIVPVAVGLGLHVWSYNQDFTEMILGYDTTWKFVIAMIVVAIANRVSAHVYQSVSVSLSAVYLFFTAGALIVAAAGGLRILEVNWLVQTVLLMLIPIAYLVAARLWRGHPPERPLGWVAHSAAAIILAHVLVGMLRAIDTVEIESGVHLMLTILLTEATVFYTLAAAFRRRTEFVFLAVVALCGAAWQMMLFLQLPQSLFTTIFAALGLGVLIAARVIGLDESQVYEPDGQQRTVTRGRGLTLLNGGHGILSLAILVAFVTGLIKVAAVGFEDRALTMPDWFSIGLITAFSTVAAMISPRGTWRRVYWVATIAMAALAFLTVNVAIDINAWRKLEIFLVVVGLIMLAASYVGRFREVGRTGEGETVSFGLWFGSLLAAVPLLITVFYHWATSGEFAFTDEAILITVCLLMLATGVVWQMKSSTLIGGGVLSTYLVVLIVSLVYRPQVAMGIYLAGGGGVLFAIGLLLAVYRDRLVTLPDRIAKRKGVFRVIGWR